MSGAPKKKKKKNDEEETKPIVGPDGKPPIRRKICFLGTPGVGKTSLVRRFVEGRYSEDYEQTVGIVISRKIVTVGESAVELAIWDHEGKHSWPQYTPAYISGASGLVFVCDSTASSTLDDVLAARQEARGYLGVRPSILFTNKSDRIPDWEITSTQLNEAAQYEWSIHKASAKTGENVEEAMQALADLLVGRRKEGK